MHYDKARYDDLCDQFGCRVAQLSSQRRDHQSNVPEPGLIRKWTTSDISSATLCPAGVRIEFEAATTASPRPYRLFSQGCRLRLLDLPANDLRLKRRSSLFFELPLKLGVLYELSLSQHVSLKTPTFEDSVVGFTPEIRLLDAMWRYLNLHEEPHDVAALAALTEREICFHLLRSPGGPALSSLVASYTHLGRIRHAINWLKQNYAKKFSLGTLAKHVGIGKPSLYLDFKRSVGVSPAGFQRLLRLDRACELINNHSQVSAAARSVGYESTHEFTGDYMKTYGLSPYSPPTDNTGYRRSDPRILGR